MKLHLLTKLTCAILILGGFTFCTSLKELFEKDGVFLSKNISSYSIKKIALLPMLPDTQGGDGTYNSTNYFLDLLVAEYPKLEFADIMDLRKHDFSFIKMMLDDVHENKLINKQEFSKTDLGTLLKKWNCDAIMIGAVDSTRREKDKYRHTMFGKNIYLVKVTCYFTYHLISMKDGKVIWKSAESGSAFYEPFGDSEILFELSDDSIALFSPIDEAMYNGLDKLYYKLPDEVFETE